MIAMPVPTKSQLSGVVSGLFESAGLRGANAPDLAEVIAEAIANTLQQFLSLATVPPGIAGAVDPVSLSGATSGPGTISVSLSAATLEPMVAGLLSGQNINGEASDGLAAAIAGTIAFAIEQFVSNVRVAPGIPIAGAVTVGPGTLI